MPELRFLHRITWWFDSDGNAVQVSVAVLDNCWEEQSMVTLAVGPFDDPEAQCTRAREQAELAAWRLIGQGRLL